MQQTVDSVELFIQVVSFVHEMISKRNMMSHRFWRISNIHYFDCLEKTVLEPDIIFEMSLWIRFHFFMIQIQTDLIDSSEMVSVFRQCIISWCLPNSKKINKFGSAVDAVVSQELAFCGSIEEARFTLFVSRSHQYRFSHCNTFTGRAAQICGCYANIFEM